MGKGHPKGLATLFFTEMWERLGFYLMLGILYLYIVDNERGGLGMSAADAGEIYGTYLAFVYFTPFLGGMIADRFLGFRLSVFLGGLMMAGGYFCLAVPGGGYPFYAGLLLLCLGNGLFKPNISAMVGNLYEPGDPRRDAGFNIFYMGINIGASLSAIVAAPLRNEYGFNMAFAAAGVGLLIAVVWLVFNWRKLAPADKRSEPGADEMSFGKICTMILLPAAIFGVAGYYACDKLEFLAFAKDSIGPITFGFIAGMLPIIGYFAMLVKTANAEEKPGLAALMPVFIAGGTFFMILHLSGGLITVFCEEDTSREAEWIPDALDFYRQKAMPSYFENADPSVPRPDERMLIKVPQETATMFGAKRMSLTALTTFVAAHPEIRLKVEDEDKDFAAAHPEIPLKAQEGLPDDLLCRIYEDENVKINTEKDAHGISTVTVNLDPDTVKSLRKVLFLKDIEGNEAPVILVTEETFKMVYANASGARLAPPGRFLGLANAELITGLLNPVFVVLLTPLVVAFFALMLRRKREITTAQKIFIGMVITTFSIAIMAWGAYLGGNGNAKVSAMWLFSYYLIITLGELCLSPMGLSLVTKLAPKRLVGLMMGGWFLSTSIGNKLSGFISGLPPTWQMFLVLGGATLLVAGFIFVLLPRLNAAIKKYGA